MTRSVWIGWDAREASAYAVARYSVTHRSTRLVPVSGIVLSRLRREGLYTRPTERRNGALWDTISEAPMSTEFACSRFLTPILAKMATKPNDHDMRWALFMDCDMLVMDDVQKLFDECDDGKAVMVVKHDHQPANAVKMDGQQQTKYSRKNWSSVCAFNLDHEANDDLTIELANSVPGRDLHRFCWLRDDDIGELDPRWNYLVGHTKIFGKPGIIHYTDGIPEMPGYENCEYANEWRAELERWAR